MAPVPSPRLSLLPLSLLLVWPASGGDNDDPLDGKEQNTIESVSKAQQTVADVVDGAQDVLDGTHGKNGPNKNEEERYPSFVPLDPEAPWVTPSKKPNAVPTLHPHPKGIWKDDGYWRSVFPGMYQNDVSNQKKAQGLQDRVHDRLSRQPEEAPVLYQKLDVLRPDLVDSPTPAQYPIPASKVAEIQRDAARVWVDNDPNDTGARFAYGDSSLRGGDYPEAEKHLRFALENGKADSRTLTAYGGAAYGMKDFKTAALSARLALQLDPSDRRAGALLKLSEGRVSQVRLPPIGEAFQGAEGERDERGAPVAEGGPGLGAASAREIARRESGRGLPGAQERSAELAKAAVSKLAVSDFAGSKEAASRALEEDPRNTQAFALRAMANNRLGLYEEARRDADEALLLSPKDTPSLLSRSLAFNRLKKHSPALEDSESVLERERRNVFAYLMKAYAHEGLHSREWMLSSLRAASSLSAAYEPLYKKALQIPTNQDALFLFERDLLPASPPAAPKGRWPLYSLAAAAAAGLALIAYLAGAASTREVQITPPAAEGVQGIGSRYEVLGKIGSGGMGEVFEGRDLALDRRVAIKKLREGPARDPSERARFLSEARIVAKLKHPCIVEIYAVLEEEDDAYLVFEFVEGKTLSELLRERGPVPVDIARAWLGAACEAVEHAHSQGVVHRDIKPSNIMVSGERVKVMDFGLSRQVQDALSRVSALTVAGTPAYMAPEQEQGSVRKESDVFALAVCFYELLTGELPFEGVGAGMLVNKLGGKLVPLSRRLGAVPPGLEEAVAKALAADPERRTRSPSEFSAALDALKLL